MTEETNSSSREGLPERRSHEMLQDQRLDRLEIHSNNTSEALKEIKQSTSEAFSDMKTILSDQSNSLRQLSDSMIKLSAIQDMTTTLASETRSNTERLYKEEKQTALIIQTLGHLDKLPERVKKVEDQQTKNKVILGAFVAAVSIVGTAVANTGIKVLGAFFGF